MDCIGCGSTVGAERPDLTAQGYHRFRCRDCGKQFNERSDGVLNRARPPSPFIAFVVSAGCAIGQPLRDLSGYPGSCAGSRQPRVRPQWEAKLTARDG